MLSISFGVNTPRNQSGSGGFLRDSTKDYEDKPFARKWTEVSKGEMYICLGIKILMGLHHEAEIRHYWSKKRSMPIHSEVIKHMSLKRWEAISTNLRIADPKFKRNAFEQVEPFNEALEDCMKCWVPGRDLAVDEMMERFQGKSYDITTIKTKPEPTGFKIWGIAEHGYLLNWLFHSKGKGTVAAPGMPSKRQTKNTKNTKASGAPPFIKAPKELGNNETAATVPLLLGTLPKPPEGCRYHVWLDNLFTSTKLLRYLRKLGYGTAGTANVKSGIYKGLAELKKWDDKVDKILWGSLIQFASQDGELIMSAWKDNAMVLYISNSHATINVSTIEGTIRQEHMALPQDQDNTIERLRKKPSKTSSRAKTAMVPHGDGFQTWLYIPLFTDDYNYSMNGVDISDQLRSYLSGHRRIRRGSWRALRRFDNVRESRTQGLEINVVATVPRRHGPSRCATDKAARLA